MKARSLRLFVAPVLLFTGACGPDAEPGALAPVAAPAPSAPPVAPPAHAAHPAYGMFVLKIDALYAQLQQRQAAGEFAAMTFPAEQIARHGRLLLAMTADLPEPDRVDLVRCSATLDELAKQVAEAAARGDGARTAALIEQYRLPLAALERHRP
jgi:hypothetical protein